jgi:hypothetical protein
MPETLWVEADAGLPAAAPARDSGLLEGVALLRCRPLHRALCVYEVACPGCFGSTCTCHVTCIDINTLCISMRCHLTEATDSACHSRRHQLLQLVSLLQVCATSDAQSCSTAIAASHQGDMSMLCSRRVGTEAAR